MRPYQIKVALFSIYNMCPYFKKEEESQRQRNTEESTSCEVGGRD
jgi:hypothetical protein